MQAENCLRKGPTKKVLPKVIKPLIGQYNKDGELLNEYRTLTEAAQAVCNSTSGVGAISNCLHHKPHYNTAYGYVWEYIYKN